MKLLLALVLLPAVLGRPRSSPNPAPHVWLANCGKAPLFADSGENPDPTRDAEGKVVGGTEARQGEFPYIVSMRKPTSHACGGTLIDKRWVVTAAHCIGDPTPEDFTMVLGEHTRSDFDNANRVTMDVERIVVHEEWGTNGNDYDIAMVKLAQDVTFNDYIQPACESDANVDHTGKQVVIAGWGTTESGGSTADTLLWTQVPVISQEKCIGQYGIDTITDRMICAGRDEGGRDTCQGDSGGPMVVKSENGANGKYSLIGIVSFGRGCALPTHAGVYTRVQVLLDWIQAVRQSV